MYLKKPQDSWNNVIGTDKTKAEMIGHNVKYENIRTIPLYLLSSIGVEGRIGAYFAATGSGQLFIETPIKYSRFRCEVSIQELKLGPHGAANLQ